MTDVIDKIKFNFKRLDQDGIQNALKELNSFMDAGYRFVLSNLLEDRPNFRSGWPSFSLSKNISAEQATEDKIKKLHSDMVDAKVKLIEKTVSKSELVSLAAELGVEIPEEVTTQSAIRPILINHLKALTP